MTTAQRLALQKKIAARLREVQLPKGNFLTLSSASLSLSRTVEQEETLFIPALILHSLKQANLASTQSVIDRLADYLANQASSHWSFNYWDRTSLRAQTHPYPDDLDDTALCLLALYETRPELFTGTVLGYVTKLLIASESQVGGPYYTWLVEHGKKSAWDDVDLAVNLNIQRLLQHLGVKLDPLTNFIEAHLLAGTIQSPYYPSPIPLYYYTSQIRLSQPVKEKLYQALIGSLADFPSFNDQLLLALSLARIAPQAKEREQLVKALEAQLVSNPELAFAPFAFCLDPTQNNQTHYAGSPALTAALVLEFLALKPYFPKNHQPAVTEDKEILTAIDKELRKRADDLPEPFQAQLITIYQRFQAFGQSKTILLTPLLMAQSISPAKSITQHQLVKLGLATLYGWIAYTIYDDFLDDEGRAEQLSVANFALRECLAIFQSITELPDSFHQLSQQLFDRIDSANCWEVSMARHRQQEIDLQTIKLPDYGDFQVLADRSIGHALGPLAVLFLAGQINSAKHLINFFTHYLIAKQLNDDAHDWQSDLAAGHLSAVVTLLLKQYRETGVTVLDRSKPDPSLSIHFWRATTPIIVEWIIDHCQKARTALTKIPSLLPASPFHQMIDDTEQAAKSALTEQQKAEAFLKTVR